MLESRGGRVNTHLHFKGPMECAWVLHERLQVEGGTMFRIRWVEEWEGGGSLGMKSTPQPVFHHTQTICCQSNSELRSDLFKPRKHESASQTSNPDPDQFYWKDPDEGFPDLYELDPCHAQDLSPGLRTATLP